MHSRVLRTVRGRSGEPVPSPHRGLPGKCVSREGHLRSARALDDGGHSKSRERSERERERDLADVLAKENAEDRVEYARYDAELSSLSGNGLFDGTDNGTSCEYLHRESLTF